MVENDINQEPLGAEEEQWPPCDPFWEQEEEVIDAVSLCDWADEDGNYREVEDSFTEEQNAENDYFEFVSEDFCAMHDLKAKHTDLFGKVILSKCPEETRQLARSISGTRENFSMCRQWMMPKSFLRRKSLNSSYTENPRWHSLFLFGSASSPYKEMNLSDMKTRQFRRCPSSPPMLRSPNSTINGDQKWFWRFFNTLGCVGVNRNMVIDASM